MMLMSLIGFFLTIGLLFNTDHKNSLPSCCTASGIIVNMAQEAFTTPAKDCGWVTFIFFYNINMKT